MIVRTALLAVLLAAPRVHADTGWAEESEEKQADAGDFLPYSQSPSPSTSFVSTLGGYDTARGGAVITSQLQLRLHERFYLILYGTYDDPSDVTFEPSVLGQVILLDEESRGVDLAVQGGWEHDSFNEVPGVVGRVAVGGHIGGSYLIGGAAIGLGTHSNERYAELTLGELREVFPDVCLGIDTRGRVDLQHDSDPLGETSWDVQAGPVVTYGTGPLAFSAIVGVSALRMHHAPDVETGAVTLLGAGTVF